MNREWKRRLRGRGQHLLPSWWWTVSHLPRQNYVSLGSMEKRAVGDHLLVIASPLRPRVDALYTTGTQRTILWVSSACAGPDAVNLITDL